MMGRGERMGKKKQFRGHSFFIFLPIDAQTDFRGMGSNFRWVEGSFYTSSDPNIEVKLVASMSVLL